MPETESINAAGALLLWPGPPAHARVARCVYGSVELWLAREFGNGRWVVALNLALEIFLRDVAHLHRSCGLPGGKTRVLRSLFSRQPATGTDSRF